MVVLVVLEVVLVVVMEGEFLFAPGCGIPPRFNDQNLRLGRVTLLELVYGDSKETARR